MNFPYRTPEKEATKIAHKAIDQGINFIDTANLYGQPLNEGAGQGLSETWLGKALKGKREKIVLATKFFARMDPDDPNSRGGSRRNIIQACEASLKRLGTDYIDLYQMHRPDPEVPIDETLRALDDLVRAGKVRYTGTSAFSAGQLMEALWEADRLHLNRFAVEQPRYNILARNIETEVVPVAQKYDIAILAYSPLAGGVLTGKYSKGEEYPADSRFVDQAWGEWATSFINDRVYALLECLEDIAKEKGCTVSQLSLAWVLGQPGVTSAIIGPRTLAHLEDNLGALEVEITEEDRVRIDEVSVPGWQMF
jgi:aryl-alcohol dehydrogenase-like predicted oxidoreductase